MADTTRQKKPSRPASNSRSPQTHLPDMNAGEAAFDYFTLYARERPEIVAMWAFGLGFVLGWKLRIF